MAWFFKLSISLILFSMNSQAKKLIGKRLKNLRKAGGKTQEQLAESVDMSSKYLSRVELGLENPTIDTFLKLANALKIEPGELFEISHEEDDAQKLRNAINELLKGVSLEKLKISVKLLKAILH